jgi:hypothetical protein
MDAGVQISQARFGPFRITRTYQNADEAWPTAKQTRLMISAGVRRTSRMCISGFVLTERD